MSDRPGADESGVAEGKRASSPPARLLLAVIWVYRKAISPWFGRHCRYEPTCSAYAAQAIRRFGAVRGSALAFKRVAGCHPWAEGGIDPVPATSDPLGDRGVRTSDPLGDRGAKTSGPLGDRGTDMRHG